MNFVRTAFFISLALLGACQLKQVHPMRDSVISISENKKGECEFLGFVEGEENSITGSALNDARNKVAKMGGNAIYIIETRVNQYENGRADAEAFRCKKG